MSRAETGEGWFGARVAPIQPLDEDHAAETLHDLADLARERELTRLEALLSGQSALASFLGAAFNLSPFLRDCARRWPHALEALFDMPLTERLAQLLPEILAAGQEPDQSEAALMRTLREKKGEAHFLIALADLAGVADAYMTVGRLSDLADACVRAAIDFLLLDAHRGGKLVLPDPAKPGERSGWIVLGMGKLGARELNFSSDIDLIVFFDPQAAAIKDPYDASDLFARLTRRLVRILQDRTEHGYVFRTDLRLRPDPGSTPLAIPVMAALIYYESRGQNWERAAMIKARPVAGDLAAGTEFLRELTPYVWRKYMDFAAIADVH